MKTSADHKNHPQKQLKSYHYKRFKQRTMKPSTIKRTIQRIFLPLSLLMSFGLIFLFNLNVQSSGLRKLPKEGDIILFGKYEQDGDESNGTEDIEWLVLNVEEDTNRVFVISRYCLDIQPYNDKFASVTWENCSLRKWLNNDFYKTAFSSKERKKIPTVTIRNDDNPKRNTSGGNDTKDKLFCLSLEEVETYFGDYDLYSEKTGWGYNQNLICSPTQYAVDKGAHNSSISKEFYYNKTWYNPVTYQNDLKLCDIYTPDVIDGSGAKWWLRSPGGVGYCVCIVFDFGESGEAYNSYVNAYGKTIRPAMYIEY